MSEVRRSGATAAAGGDTATSLPVSANRDAPHHSICICDPELRALGIFDLRCPSDGLAATLREALRTRKENERG